jgi:hypothetical protein
MSEEAVSDNREAELKEYALEAPDDWYPIILEAHTKLMTIDPTYQIQQIKEKFNGLRYYFHSDRYDYKSPQGQRMNDIVRDAESDVDTYEVSRREAQSND